MTLRRPPVPPARHPHPFFFLQNFAYGPYPWKGSQILPASESWKGRKKPCDYGAHPLRAKKRAQIPILLQTFPPLSLNPLLPPEVNQRLGYILLYEMAELTYEDRQTGRQEAENCVNSIVSGSLVTQQNKKKIEKKRKQIKTIRKCSTWGSRRCSGAVKKIAAIELSNKPLLLQLLLTDGIEKADI